MSDIVGNLGHLGAPSETPHSMPAVSHQLQEACKVATITLAQLESENGLLRREVTALRQALLAMLPKEEIAFTREELRDLEENGIAMDQILAEITREAGGEPPVVPHG